MPIDVYEGSQLQPSVTFSLSLNRSVEFTFAVTSPTGAGAGVAVPPQNTSFTGRTASCTSDLLPNVPDGLTHYRVHVQAFIPQRLNATSHGSAADYYRVWMRSVAVELVPVDSAGTAIAMQATPFSITDTAGTVTNTTTDGGGRGAVIAAMGGVTIAPRLPWIVHRWVNGAADRGRLRKAEVKVFEAGFISPAPAKHEWIVNRATASAGADKRGRVVTIRVGGKGDSARLVGARTGIPGAVVYIVCTFSKTTARTDLGVALQDVDNLATANSGRKQTGSVTLGLDKTAVFRVDLGFAGGETCKVEIGTQLGMGGALAAVHETLEFETWREFDYELLVPQSDGLDCITDCTVLKSKTEAEFSAGTLSALKTALDPLKVRLTKTHSSFYKATDMPNNGANCMVADVAALNPAKGGSKGFLLPLGDKDAMLGTLPNRNAATLSVIVCDLFAYAREWTQSFAKITKSESRNAPDNRYLLPRTLDDSIVARGSFAISKLRWRATHYTGTLLAIETPITQPTDPGGAATGWTDLTTETDIAAHVTFNPDLRSITFNFPSTKPAFPGAMFPLQGGALTWTDSAGRIAPCTITIEIEIQGVCLHLPAGAAERGDIALATAFGAIHDNCLARSIAHELGHCMGQAYGGKTLDASRGRTSANPGIPFPAVVPGGNVYTGRGHQGLHCAYGVTSKGDDPYIATHTGEARCVMYGSAGGATNATLYTFCPDCTTFVLGEDISDVRKDWKA